MFMEELRKEINEIDRKIIELLAQRFEVSKKVAVFKHSKNIQIYDKAREDELIKKQSELFSKLGYSNSGDFKFIEEFYLTILSRSKEIQKEEITKLRGK